jgi:hypothetical protein
VLTVLASLEDVLRAEERTVQAGASLAAAQAVYAA